MTIKHMFELIPQIWELYRPWLPLRAGGDLLTAVGHPGDASRHWPAIACVAVATVLLLGLSKPFARSTTGARRLRRQILASGVGRG